MSHHKQIHEEVMIGEIIAIGDELTSGRILNTTSNFAAGHLFAAGHEIISMSTIGDKPGVIEASLKRALKRAEFIIVTGGLGATSDDLTNETVAKALGRPTRFFPEIFEKMTRKGIGLKGNGRKAKNHPLEKLAWLPEGAIILKPEANMAGHLLEHEEIPIFFLPGVPHEMRELMLDCVLPYLASMQSQVRLMRQKIYKLFGITESLVNQKLKNLEGNDPYIRLGYYPVYPEVHVCLTVHGNDEKDIEEQFNRFDIDIVSLLSPYIFGAGEDTMQSVVGALLKKKELKLAIAESCTGGLISHQITRVSGSSDYFSGSIIAYSNHIKKDVLAVPEETIETRGAVSSETAEAMAEGVLKLAGADLGISTTGIAGPEGGSVKKPIGTVWFGLANGERVMSFLHTFKGERWKIQANAAQTALDLIRQYLLDPYSAPFLEKGKT